jgi:hypothetical protein
MSVENVRLPPKDLSNILGLGVNMEKKRLAWAAVAAVLPIEEEPYPYLDVPAASTMGASDLHYTQEVYDFAEVLANDPYLKSPAA